MISTINITFTGTLKQGITNTDITNFLKEFIFSPTTYLFESEPQCSFQKGNEDVINIKDTVIRLSIAVILPLMVFISFE
jgi:hypothetical protein